MIDGVARQVDQPTLVRSRRPDRGPGHGRTRPCSPSCWPIRSSRRRRPRAPAASASATPTPRRCTRGCPAPTASPPRSSSPRGASRRRWRAGRPPGTEVVASGGGCHHPGTHGGARAAPRRAAAATRSAGSTTCSFPATPRRRSPSRCSGYLTLHGQPGNVPAATGAERRPGARHGHARMSTATAAPDPGRLILPALRADADERLRPRGGPHRRRARPRRRRVHHLRRHRRDRSAG